MNPEKLANKREYDVYIAGVEDVQRQINGFFKEYKRVFKAMKNLCDE